MSDAAKLQQKLQDAMANHAGSQDVKPAQRPVLSGLPRSVSADLMEPPKGPTRLLSLSLVALVFGALIWSAWAIVDEVTVGEGKVVPAGKVQHVQNLEGGIINEINIKPGAVVKKGQLLVRIDPTGFGSKLGELREQLAGLSARLKRLNAELNGTPLIFDAAFEKTYPKLIAQNKTLYTTRLDEIKAALSALANRGEQKAQEIRETNAAQKNLGRSLTIARKELALIAPLVAENIVSDAELLLAEGKVVQLEGQLEATRLALPRLEAGLNELKNLTSEKRYNFQADIIAKMNDAQIKFAALNQSMKGDADRVKRTVVRSPVDGIVKAIHINTIGQVVKPGDNLVEIVPQTESLLIETRVRPRDIAFLRVGQDAVVKLTAYDYALYGSLHGKLERISADSITDEKGETYYIVDVRASDNFLMRDERKLPIIPGMVAQVDIMTGEKTVFNYMTKPMHRMANEALRER